MFAIAAVSWLDRYVSYTFHDRWTVAGTIDEVANVMRAPELLPEWWLRFQGVEVHAIDKDHGVATQFTARIRGFMPYELCLEFEVDEMDFPSRFHVRVGGDFSGMGRGTLTQEEDRVRIDYELNICIVRRSLRWLYLVARPVGFVQHAWVMMCGQAGLRRELARRERTCELEIAS